MSDEIENRAESNMTENSNLLKRRLPSFKLIAVFIWLSLSLALAGWWLLFGLKQLDKIAALQNASAQDILRQHRMLMSEGGFLFALLLIGGISLLYYISVEISRAKQVQTFFAAFTHDLKTSLASLRLQAEALEEDLKDHQSKYTEKIVGRIAGRIIRDTVRLELQLNNSLSLAQDGDNQFFFEDLSFRKSVDRMRQQWTELAIEVKNDCTLKADARALESICNNIIQNAIIHGHASKIEILCKASSATMVQVDFRDNGDGFNGKERLLADLFVRHSSTSGTGIGLYLVKSLCKRMGGYLDFKSLDKGFLVSVHLPGRLA